MTVQRDQDTAHNTRQERPEAHAADRATVDGVLQADVVAREGTALLELPTVITQAADSVVITDREGAIEYVNPAFEACTGYTLQEVKGYTPRKVKSGLHDQSFYELLWATILAGKPFRAVFINRKKDGSLYYDDKTITPLKDHAGQITHFVSAGRDVTQRIQAEEQLRDSREQLRALAAYLESVREEERTRISRQIHDELGQMLTALKIDLSWMAAKLSADQAALLERMQVMGRLVDTAIRSTQRISTELRPSILDHLGLVAAVEWQAREFQTRTGIGCRVSADLAEFEPDPEVSTTLFRILQETLTNIIRHAHATVADISLGLDQDRLVLAVVDNGRGITEPEIADRRSLGLLGMRERALLLGGEVAITGRPGGGTAVRVTIPLTQPCRR
ncbi:MAG: histidine kinase [Candidatus Methylomirabilota bacterium]|nr:MAG: histidine kinase [candidate division NC10 bacterium]